MAFRLSISTVAVFAKGVALSFLLSLLIVASASANKTCDAINHINELRKAGWYVVAEDVGCAASLVPKLTKIIADNGHSSGIGQALVKESVGPICLSLAWEQVKQGCLDPAQLNQATLYAETYIDG